MAYEPKRIPTIVTLEEDQVLDDDPTSKNSDPVPTESYTHFALFLKVLSAGAPTDIVFKIQFSNDGGTTWWDLQNDFFGDLRYSDAAVATVVNEVMDGPCSGRLLRLRAVGTGTAVSDTFTYSAYLEFYR